MAAESDRMKALLKKTLAAQVDEELVWIYPELEKLAKSGKSHFVISKEYGSELYYALWDALSRAGFKVRQETQRLEPGRDGPVRLAVLLY
jgi:hypothetical protein